MFKKRRPTDFETPGREHGWCGSKKQRVIDCAKVLLDIAKESADWFPPLKAALGGVNALINHYEQFEDVKEKIMELLPQLDRFKRNLDTAKADGDTEETNRRQELTNTLKQIEEESQRLLAKNAITRFADKGKDTKVVAGLIERLREAIVSYQISQQQAIYTQVTRLAASFDTLLQLREKPRVMRDKLGSVVAQLDRLKDSPWKELQHERWAKLIDDLRPIRDKAMGLHECIAAERYTESEDDIAAVSGLAGDLHDILLEYWMAQQQAVQDQNSKLIDAADLSVLNGCHRAQGAEYRHGNRRGCLKGTRDTVLNEVGSWAKDFSQSPVFWLNGLAGTGKSTIAQTVAERLFAEDCLGASFFCSRDFEDRSNLRFIFPTLAFQLAHKYPDFRWYFVSLLRSNPDIAHESLCNQMEKLIVEPLRTTGTSTVIVIDALDECKDDEPSSAMLSVLGRFVGQIPSIKFFITGRPEPRIKTGFRLPLLVDLTNVFVLHDVQPSLINNDIRLFLKHELCELARRRQLGGWPSNEHVDLLCHRAAGLFVYAVATAKFLDSNTHLPEHRLYAILKLPESTLPEGKTRFNQRTTLDSLYTSILQTAFSEEDPDVDPKVRSTIGAMVLVVNPLPPRAIAELIGLDPKEVILFLTLIQSLLAVGEDFSQPTKPFHKSFPDFITDPLRCTDTRFFVSPRRLHLELALNCLRVMNDGLERNLLSLPEYALNSEVEDLQARIDDRLGVALQYACRSWHNHLCETRGDVTGVISYLRIFLDTKFLAWLETLSVLGDVGAAAVALEKLVPWLQEVFRDERLLETVRDYLYFVTKFFEPIDVSATHIYHSALELCPTSSIVRKRYYYRCDRDTSLPRVVIGTPDSWDPTAFVSGKDYECYTWSPCGRFIAAQMGGAVEIRNQLTFELLTTLQPTETTPHLTGPLAYSPDGRSIACASDTAIVVWDIQTGGVAKEVHCRTNNTSLVWSLDGKIIGTLNRGSKDVQRPETYVNMYHVASGAVLLAAVLPCLETPVLPGNAHLWADKVSLRVTTASAWGASEFAKVGSNLCETKSPNHPDRGRYFAYDPETSSFSPATRHISVSACGSLSIYGGRDFNCLLKVEGHFLSHCFSPDGRFFAAVAKDHVHVWDRASGRYDPSKKIKIPCRDQTGFLQFSQASTSILGRSENILQVWRLYDLPVMSQARCRQLAGLSSTGDYIVTARESERAITILDLHSQTPSQFIDASMGVKGLVLTGNVLLVVGTQKVVGWLLTEDGLVSGVFGTRRASDQDSIWAVELPWESSSQTFSVEGQVGKINSRENTLFAYHTGSGEVLPPTHAFRHSSGPWYFSEVLCGRHYLFCHNLSRCDVPGGGVWRTSQATLREGWVKDPEGRHRLWIPVDWRASWDCADWRHDSTIQFSIVGDDPVVVKF